MVPMAELNRVLATPLLICNDRAAIRTSPADCARRLHPALPIQDVCPLVEGTDYAHKSVSFDLGCLGVSIGLGSPFRYQVDDHDMICFHLSFGGQALIAIGGEHYEANLERPGLYLPGEGYRAQIRQPHGVVMTTRLESIAAQALILADQAGVDGLDLSVLQRPLAIGPSREIHARLLRLMGRTLALLNGDGGASLAIAAQEPGSPGAMPSRRPGLHLGQDQVQDQVQDQYKGQFQGPGRADVTQEQSIATLLCRQIAAMVYPELLARFQA